MNIFLWVLQIVLAAAFAAHGWLFLAPPAELLAVMNTMLTTWFRLFLGVAEVLAAVGRMESLQRSDSFAARDMSNDIGARVHALPRMARGLRAAGERAQREAERLEQHRQELARGELESAWQESV